MAKRVNFYKIISYITIRRMCVRTCLSMQNCNSCKRILCVMVRAQILELVSFVRLDGNIFLGEYCFNSGGKRMCRGGLFVDRHRFVFVVCPVVRCNPDRRICQKV